VADNQITVRKQGIPFFLAVFAAWFATIALGGDKTFSPPPATHANTYPIFEAHDDEGVSIAIDPYDAPEKAALFKVKYREIGFIPIRLIISNDSAKALMLDSIKVQYITGGRIKLQPATQDDIFRRIARPDKLTSQPTVRLPIPGPRKRPTAVSPEAAAEVDAALFLPVPVTPHSTNSGFLFFDVSDIKEPKTGAHIYISGIRAGTKELFYFDIPLEKFVEQAPAK
jgi:hypothetical protein